MSKVDHLYDIRRLFDHEMNKVVFLEHQFPYLLADLLMNDWRDDQAISFHSAATPGTNSILHCKQFSPNRIEGLINPHAPPLVDFL